MTDQPNDLPLSSYRILDLTEGGNMLGGRVLADLGADVIKIEPPGGSPSRIGPYFGGKPDPEKSLFWFAYNANKRGVTLDLKVKEDQEKFKQLAATADAVVESLSPGYMDKLGLGYKDLVKIRQDIVYTSVTPYGQTGPRAHYRGSDLTAWASGGYLYDMGNPDRPPTWVSFPQAYLFGAGETAAGTLTALHYRQETGEGQFVDVSQQEAAMSPTFNALLMWMVDRFEYHRTTGFLYIPATQVTHRESYRCKDGWVTMLAQGGMEPHASSTRALLKWMAEEGMSDEFLDKLDTVKDLDAQTAGKPVYDHLSAGIERFTLTKTKAELYKEAIKRHILMAPINDSKDIANDEHLQFRKFFETVPHPELGKDLTYCGAWLKLSETPLTIRRRAPLIGEHNKEILGSLQPTSKPPAVRPAKSVHIKKVFEGVKVAEFAWVVAGPASSKYLADHGATVVKIESHLRPDFARSMRPFPGGAPSFDNSMYFGRHNSNKLSVSIDISTPNGRKLAWKLIMWADIITESFSPGVMKKMGLDYESVKKVRPDIIYLSSSMQGQYGPAAGYAGFGPNAAGLAGFSSINGWPDRFPAPPFGAYTDYVAPRFNAPALIAALEYRRRTGKGQYLEQSQVESSIHFTAPLVMDYLANGHITGRTGNRYDYAAPHGVFPCTGDDYWVAVAVFSDNDWQAFSKALGNPAWTRDPKFATLEKRKTNEDELEKHVSEWTSQHKPGEVEKILQDAGVIAAVVAKGDDVESDEQLKHRKYFKELEHKIMGKQKFEPQACYVLSKTPREIVLPPPCMGEHNDYVFKKLLGMTDEEVAACKADHSITDASQGNFRVSL